MAYGLADWNPGGFMVKLDVPRYRVAFEYKEQAVFSEAMPAPRSPALRRGLFYARRQGLAPRFKLASRRVPILSGLSPCFEHAMFGSSPARDNGFRGFFCGFRMGRCGSTRAGRRSGRLCNDANRAAALSLALFVASGYETKQQPTRPSTVRRRVCRWK